MFSSKVSITYSSHARTDLHKQNLAYRNKSGNKAAHGGILQNDNDIGTILLLNRKKE